jgi:hypothetical protein
MVTLGRNAIKRRARDSEGNIIAPMDLANMRTHGVRSVEAKCFDCKHEAIVK